MYNAPDYVDQFLILDGKWKVIIQPVSFIRHEGYSITLFKRNVVSTYDLRGKWVYNGESAKYKFAQLKFLLERTLWNNLPL